MRGANKFLILLTIVAVALGGLAIVAHADTIIGEFEIDGNKIDESGAGQPYDWNTLPGAVIFADPDPGSGCPAGEDDQFSGGGSTEESPNTWIFSCGPSPSKDNILEAGIGTRKIDGDTWLYLYFSRQSESGSAVLNYEFNRSAETFTNSKGSVVPKRTAGDLLVNLSVDNGGANTEVDLYSWNGNHTSGNWDPISLPDPPVRGTDWEVETDADSRGRFGFAELAINLPAFGVTPSCPGLGKAWIKSNSTHDFHNGVLKDRTVRKDVPLNNCATKDWEFTVSPQGIAGTSVYAVYTAGNENRTLQLTDPDGDGKYTGTDGQIPPGSVTFRFEVRNGANVIYSTSNGSESFAEGERKTNRGSLAYSISLTPEDAENFADSFAGKPQPHVLTAKVVNTANNQGLPFVPVNFSNLGSCGSLSATTGTTNASGEVTTTLTSANPCSTSVRAWVNGTASGSTAGFDTGEANDTASKKFVSYSLTMSPDAINEVGKAHTFVVTLKKDIGDGNGEKPVSGASLSLKLDPASTDATITAVSNGTIVDPPTTATCTTDANGQCSVTINKPTPGSVALVAEYTATDSSQRQVKIDSRGNKQFLDFALSISNGGKTNEVGTDHTFTVTLTKDDGTSTTPLAGETVHLVLAPGASDAQFKTINGAPPGAGEETTSDCTTKADGTCEVVIAATTPGAVKLTASWTTELASGTVTRTAEATKTYVDFALSISNGGKTNEVDTDHTFTVTLTKGDGTNTTPLAGETVHLVLDQGGSDAHFKTINGAAASGTSADCTTKADGTCAVVITATTPGAVKLTATWTTEVASGTVERSAEATKNFVDFDLTVSNGGKTNDVNTDHPFTVTLTKDDGTTTTPLAGETVHLVLDQGGSDAHFKTINGAAASGTSADCTTKADGTCAVVITATTPGAVKLTASWTTQLDSGTVTRQAEATKQFLDFALTIANGGKTNDVNSDHTFTVTLTKDDGTNTTPLAGETVHLVLDQGGSDANFKTINGVDASGTSADCTTKADGTCEVVIAATTPGAVKLTATWTTELDSGTVTREAEATKTYQDFNLDISNGGKTNDVNTDHPFTVALTRNDGTNTTPLVGETVHLVLDPGASDAHFKTINDAAASGTEADCVTRADDPDTAEKNEAGTCEVVITATTPGAVKLTATWTDELDSGTVTREAEATKNFIDFALEITPPTATNSVGQNHTFLVTLTRNDGTTTTRLSGETVHLVLDPGGSDVHFTSINGVAASGTTADCVTRTDDESTTETNEAGTCEVVITATTPGTAKLTGSWTSSLDSGTVTRTDEATKQYLAFNLDVSPERAFNRVGEPHTFIVTLTQNDGSTTTRVGGETVHLSLNTGSTGAHFTNINSQPATGTEADCVTRPADDPATTDLNEMGTCAVTFTAPSAGTAVLTATWTKEIGGSSISLSDTGTKIFLAIDVTKASCPVDTSPRGGIVDYTVSFSVGGAGLTNATFTDSLPSAVRFVSASTINGVAPQTSAVGASGGTVKWSFPTIAEGSYTGTIRVTVAPDAQLNTTVTNTVTLDAEEIDPESASHAITVTDAGRSASGRAYGLKADILGSELIPPTPDSDDTNPAELLAVPDPFGSTTPLVRVLGVEETDNSTTDQSADSATATALGVDLNVPGVLHLKASSVVAKTSSQASATGAGSARGGSLIQDLWINDHRYGNVSEPTTVLVRDPLSGDVLAEVHLLETSRSGAAAGQAQPNADTKFASGMAVNGIHVKVHLLDLADVIVSHAETQAAFPSGLGCGGQIPAVSGSAYALGVDLKPDSDDGIDLGNIKVAQVNLPITGGQDDATLADVNVPDVVKADLAEAHTIGEITDVDGDGVPVEADSRSRIAGLDLLAGTIKATVIEATSHSQVGATSTGGATIAHLEIGGTNVCEALGLTSVCTPEPNTVLLIPEGPVLVELNEQIAEPGGLTVNAVHIWVLGKDNPFGLPVGAEIVIANAHSDAHPAGAIAVTDRQITINVKALSAPSAKRLLPKVTPAPGFTLPQVVELPAEAPSLAVQDIIRDPVSILDELNTLPIPEDVLEDAEKLVQTLIDPEALLEALADPTTLLEGLEDPAAAIDALAEVVDVLAGEPAAEASPATPAETETEQLEALLRKLAGL